MASGGKRAGERVLESKHVIVLFLLMLLFSGLFFTLGYVMGRNQQYDGQARAAPGYFTRPDPVVLPKAEPVTKKTPVATPAATASDPATSANSDWEFYSNNKPAKSEPRLEPAPKAPVVPPASTPVSAKTSAAPASPPARNITVSTPSSIQSGALMLQVAACLHQDDALAVASSLRKKHFNVVVLNPQTDKYYRVQVGPLKDQKAAEETKKGLESAGFKAFYVKH